LSALHAGDLLASVLQALVTRTGVDPARVGQTIGGCVQQVGMQSANITRTGWLTAGLPLEVPATTVNVQCGSGQQHWERRQQPNVESRRSHLRRPHV